MLAVELVTSYDKDHVGTGFYFENSRAPVPSGYNNLVPDRKSSLQPEQTVALKRDPVEPVYRSKNTARLEHKSLKLQRWRKRIFSSSFLT